jgi:hypothetical protein
MRAPRRSGALAVLLLAAAVGAALFVAVSPGGGAAPPRPPAAGWRGFVGGPHPDVPLGDRMIVVLTTPSVADRLAKTRYATEAQERSWTSQALAAQQQVLTTLATAGIVVRPDERFARVLDGFSATLDPRAVALLERDQDVAGVYPVRAAFPAATAAGVLAADAVGAEGGYPGATLPGDDGRGVTVALLDTGVELGHPYLRGRVLPGIDVVGGSGGARAERDPQDPAQVERHGTELAGIVVGANGPDGMRGVAPGATLLPIRVAGWQPDSDGHEVVYARSDQLLAGLDRAVDPNGDGDCHDAARVALVGLAEPYAGFTDSPEARAVQGALELGTVVVAPAGNDGAAGPLFGSVSGPAAAPGAVAVAASDARPRLEEARVVLRRGLDVLYDSVQPLLGLAVPARPLTLAVATPRGDGSAASDFFDRTGSSLVAGKAAVVPIGADPQSQVQAAAAAGAAAVLLHGPPPPAGALKAAPGPNVPVAWLPEPAAAALLASRRAGLDVEAAIGSGRPGGNPERGLVAGFSSRGLAFDGRVKPDLAAPGVGVATAEPGAAPDGTARYGTLNGTSAAAAVVAGAAARLAEMRPNLDAEELRSLLVGYAQAGGAPVTEVGAGSLRVGAAASGEVTADQASLGFGIWQGRRWHATRTLVLRNVSTRRLQLSVDAVTTSGESEALRFRIVPNHLVLREGRASRVQVTVTAPAAPPADLATGAVEVAPAGGETLRVPWALAFAAPASDLLQHVSLDRASFAPSDTSPAILSLQVGDVLGVSGTPQVEPVARLDVLLYGADGSFRGVMARLRDLLPGSYSFGITGRGPSSAVLAPGRYELRLAAWPTLPARARPSRATVDFQVR